MKTDVRKKPANRCRVCLCERKHLQTRVVFVAKNTRYCVPLSENIRNFSSKLGVQMANLLNPGFWPVENVRKRTNISTNVTEMLNSERCQKYVNLADLVQSFPTIFLPFFRAVI